MSLVLNEDQQMLQQAARNFCQKHTPISQLRQLRDSRDEHGFDRQAYQQMVELGWTGMSLPEAYGGFEFGHSGLAVVLEETGRTLTCSPLIASVLLGGNLIYALGNEAQKQALLPGLIAGDLLLALAIDETPFHNPTRIQTRAERQGDHYLLNGRKTLVLDGHVADKLLIVARSSGSDDSVEGLSVFLLDRNSPGLEVTRQWMVDSRNSASMVLDDVKVSAEDLLGSEGQAWQSLEQVLDIARVGLAAEMLGSIQESFARIVDYLNQRQQFGVLIGSFQGLQHRAAVMYSEIELCTSIVRAAVAALDNRELAAQQVAALASAAKAKLSEVAELVSNEGVQMHGGIGMTDEFDIGFFIKRARVAQQFLGDAAFHRDRYASLNNF
ncbi:MAG: acyl-CoA/acyl-ACP dehydrogenase [Pseudomonadales bacterium]|nr:acyl-CoA/acyl-ACP dehydrogenase [Pseudomonadales bacterium]